MVTRPQQPVLVPIGQPLGTIFVDVSPVPQVHVRVGDSVHALNPPQALLWEVAHTTSPGRLTGHTRAELHDVLREPFGAADADIDVAIEHMLDAELLAELPMQRDAMVAFGRDYRMLALLHGIGNAPDRMDAFGFGLGADGYALASLLDSEIINHAAAFESVFGVCDYLCDAVGANPHTAHLGTAEALVEHVVGTMAPYLHTHTVCLDLALSAPGARQ